MWHYKQIFSIYQAFNEVQMTQIMWLQFTTNKQIIHQFQSIGPIDWGSIKRIYLDYVIHTIFRLKKIEIIGKTK